MIFREAEKLRFATTTAGEAQLFAHKRKLDSIEKLWRGVLSITNNCPGVLKFLDFVLVEEYQHVVKNDLFRTLLKGVELSAIKSVLEKIIGDHEEVRPYVGEILWTQFNVYQTIVLRACFLVSRWNEDISNLNWRDDKMIHGLISSALGEADFLKFIELKYGHLGWIQQKLTEKILNNMNKIITGEMIGVDVVRYSGVLED